MFWEIEIGDIPMKYTATVRDWAQDIKRTDGKRALLFRLRRRKERLRIWRGTQGDASHAAIVVL